MTGTGLSVDDVTVEYGTTVAVDGACLEVAAGTTMALLGPSGCGKSTLLRAIAGLEPVTRGTVRWGGADITSVPAHRRGIGLMFQEHALFPHRNVADNVAFGLRMAGVSRADTLGRTDEMLTLVGLSGFGDRSVGTLSGGQAQRVALARALAPRPRLLLLDEPFGSLDRALRDRLLGEIRDIVQRLDITTVHVTHDHDEAVSVADQLALMTSGRIIRTGAVETLLRHPGDIVTAELLGIETLISGSVGPQGHIDSGIGRFPVGAEPGGSAHVLVRPESVRIAGEGRAATVTGSRYRGGAWLLTCALDGADHTTIVASHPDRLEAGTPVRLDIDVGAAVELAAQPEDPDAGAVIA